MKSETEEMKWHRWFRLLTYGSTGYGGGIQGDLGLPFRARFRR